MDYTNDVDIQQHEAETTANSMSHAKRKFKVCFHNHWQGNKCLECNKVFTSFESMLEERKELISEYC